MLGTHNSLTYHKPQWYFLWLNFTSECQEIDIEAQYDLGVRLFDFRIRFSNDKVKAGHGIMTYDVDFDSLYSFLDGKGDCVIHIVLENHFWEGDEDDERFVSYVNEVKEKYKNIKFVCGARKNPWKTLVKLDSVPIERCFEYFHGEDLKFPLPKHYAKMNNKSYRENMVDPSRYYMFDFINI